MTPADIADELQRLNFDRQFEALKIDRDVRDFLVAALSARPGGKA